MLRGDRLEYDDERQLVWDVEGWIGGDLRRLWLKAEGEAASGSVEEQQLQLLYSHALRPFWDLQLGIRHDRDPSPARNHAVIGLNGLAPYWFEVDAALFLSDAGIVSGRVELEYDLRFTQRLLLQPRLELDFALEDDPAIAQERGIGHLEAGLRLRYEVVREFAPYLGVAWRRRNDALSDSTELVWLAGIRFWL